ncbi:TAXI family TRAP transporter solute-binding subunit [Litorivicinus lipolyticus]|uniref:TAXI family TRAP transporter solute-binding subunit n=1 Tax=Litorivicinus lipolyticus TaxID=418701 RepID=UPI003B5B06E5
MKSLIKIAAAVTATAMFATTASAERIAFGATNSQSAHYAYFASLAKVVQNAYPELQTSVVETGATVDNLKRMARGQLDAGLITTSSLYHAYNGIKKFDGEQIGSRLLFAYALAPQNIIVRRDAGVSEISQLSGVRYGPGQRGSSTEATAEEVMSLFGVTPEWVRGSNGELASAIKDGRANGFIKSAVGTSFDALTTDIATFTPVQVLGLSDQQVDVIKTRLPELSIVDMPGGDMENSGPYMTYGFMIGVSARPDMSDEIAYKITKAAISDRTIQAAAFPSLKGVDIAELTVKYATSPIHPGAVRALEEAGYPVSANLK